MHKYSFFPLAVVQWNHLPSGTVDALILVTSDQSYAPSTFNAIAQLNNPREGVLQDVCMDKRSFNEKIQIWINLIFLEKLPLQPT